MKNFRRQSKKRSRAQNFDDLEKVFFELVQKHNILVKSHRSLQQSVNRIHNRTSTIEDDHRVYGLEL